MRPIHEAGRETRGHYDSLQLHPWIEPTPCNDKGLAFMYGHHSETHNYRPACVRTGLAAPRRPSLVVQEIYRVAVGVASERAGLCYSGYH